MKTRSYYRDHASIPNRKRDSSGDRTRQESLISKPSRTPRASRTPSRTPSPRASRTPSPRSSRTPSPRSIRTPSRKSNHTPSPSSIRNSNKSSRTPSPRSSRTPSPKPTRTPSRKPNHTTSPRSSRTSTRITRQTKSKSNRTSSRKTDTSSVKPKLTKKGVEKKYNPSLESKSEKKSDENQKVEEKITSHPMTNELYSKTFVSLLGAPELKTGESAVDAMHEAFVQLASVQPQINRLRGWIPTGVLGYGLNGVVFEIMHMRESPPIGPEYRALKIESKSQSDNECRMHQMFENKIPSLTIRNWGCPQHTLFGKTVSLSIMDKITMTAYDWLVQKSRTRAELVKLWTAILHLLDATRMAGLTHGDGKMENVALDIDPITGAFIVKWIDFGFAENAVNDRIDLLHFMEMTWTGTNNKVWPRIRSIIRQTLIERGIVKKRVAVTLELIRDLWIEERNKWMREIHPGWVPEPGNEDPRAILY